MKRIMATKRPQGRFMKKHQRQVAYCVKEPPTKGPRTLAMFAQPPGRDVSDLRGSERTR